MPERALEAVRAAIARSPSGFHEISPELFGPAEKALDALKGFMGALVRSYPAQGFEIRATPEVLRRLGLSNGYISVGSEMVFLRHGETQVAGTLRVAFAPRR